MAELKSVVFIVILILFSSCKKEADPMNSTGGVFMPSLGLGGHTSASLAHYNKGSNQLLQFVASPFHTVGAGTYTMKVFRGRAYLPVYESTVGGDLIVYSLDDLSVVGNLDVTDATSVCILNDTLAYVSHVGIVPDSTQVLGGYILNMISSFNPETMELLDTIAENVSFSEMLKLSDGFVVASGESYLYKIDPSIGQIVSSIYIAGRPTRLVQDANGKVWTITHMLSHEPMSVVKINPISMQVEATFALTESFGPQGNPWDNAKVPSLSIDGSGTMLYWVYDTKVYRMPIGSGTVPTTPFVSGGFFQVGVDPVDSKVYASKGHNFNNGQSEGSWVHRFTENGVFLDSLQVGIGSVTFCFY